MPQHAPELLPDFLAMRTIRIGIQDRAHAAIRDLFHDEEGPIERGRVEFERDWFRNWQSQFVKRTIRAEFRRAVGLDQARHRIAAQDQRAQDGFAVLYISRTKPIGLPARPAGNAREVRHDKIGRPQFRREIGLQAGGKIGAHAGLAGSKLRTFTLPLSFGREVEDALAHPRVSGCASRVKSFKSSALHVHPLTLPSLPVGEREKDV